MKDIPGFEGLYAITEDGRVWGYKKWRSPAGWRKTVINWSGYERIQLRKGGKYYYSAVHRLVAMTYVPNPSNYSEVNHIDGNKQNNRVENLEWCTHSHNIQHADRTGLRKVASGKDHYQTKRKLILEGV
jgi:hypothetical protein